MDTSHDPTRSCPCLAAGEIARGVPYHAESTLSSDL